MKPLIAENTHEEIVRHYLNAFMASDSTGMLEQVHPAVHYERFINRKQTVLINGIESFKRYVYKLTHAYKSSFTLDAFKHKKDYVDVAFHMMVQPTDTSPEQHTAGHAQFWFMDEKIFQIVVEV